MFFVRAGERYSEKVPVPLLVNVSSYLSYFMMHMIINIIIVLKCNHFNQLYVFRPCASVQYLEINVSK